MKKILSGILAAAMAMSVMSVAAFAADAADGTVNFAGAWDGNDEAVGQVEVTANTIEADTITPNKKFYVPLVNSKAADGDVEAVVNPVWDTDTDATTSDLKDKDLFKFDYDKETNSKMIKKIELLTDKRVNGVRYDAVLYFELADSMTTSEIHTDGEITFTAKRDSKTGENTFKKGDKVTIDYSFWINNEEKTNDDNPEAGDRIYYNPEENETNTLIWGDDLAALEFEADDDAGKFYARLSTSADRTIYSEYADPVDADLWFYDFVGNPSIPATSRATLVLGIPWDEDADYVPNPSDAYIYEKNSDGTLTDVTEKFTYSEDEYEIPGWGIKTRTLGSYIVSDTELDIEVDEEEESSSSASSSTSSNSGKDIPQTGSSDMVNVAVVAAVLSLAAAGAVAFKKVSK